MNSRPVRHIKAADRVIIVRETVALGIDCAHCPRESLSMNQHGIVSWLSPHGHASHANSTTMLELNMVYINIASPKDLRMLRQAIDEQLGNEA